MGIDAESVGIWSAIGSMIAGAIVGAFKLGRRQSRCDTTLEDVLEAIRCGAESTRETLSEEGTETRGVLNDMTWRSEDRAQKTETTLAILLERTDPASRPP